MKLHAVQAKHGDCLILEFGTDSNPQFILIDGGPPTIFKQHLKSQLEKLSSEGRKLELVILSHVDADHITGLLDLMSYLEEQNANDDPWLIGIEQIWQNTFDKTIGEGNDIATRFASVMAQSNHSNKILVNSDLAVNSINQGNKLKIYSRQLQIPNLSFDNDLITVEENPRPIKVGSNLSLQIIGPTQKNLDSLKQEWVDWLDKNEEKIQDEDPDVAEFSDKSIPNLGSIMLLAKSDDKTILFTGDGRGDHILDGIKKQGLLNANGTYYVDILKVPHHGSDRNVTKEFFKKIQAKGYVISGDGRHGNPDYETLSWIVEAAHEDERKIEIFTTNPTNEFIKLLQNYSHTQYGYNVTVMDYKAHSIIIDPNSFG